MSLISAHCGITVQACFVTNKPRESHEVSVWVFSVCTFASSLHVGNKIIYKFTVSPQFDERRGNLGLRYGLLENRGYGKLAVVCRCKGVSDMYRALLSPDVDCKPLVVMDFARVTSANKHLVGIFFDLNANSLAWATFQKRMLECAHIGVHGNLGRISILLQQLQPLKVVHWIFCSKS